MKKRILIPVILASTLAVAGFLGFKAYRTVRAAVEVPAANPAITLHGWGGSSQALADALGVTLEELNTAKENAYNAGIDEALSQGLITQAQADSLKAKTFGAPFGRGWDRWLAGQGIDFDSLLAKELGITVEELNTARQKAQAAEIDQAVTDGRITEEQANLIKGRLALATDDGFLSAMKTAFTNAVNQAVQSGVITQAQADALLKNMDTNGYNFMGKMGGHPEFGMRRGGHGAFGPGNFLPDSETTPPTGTVSPSTGL